MEFNWILFWLLLNLNDNFDEIIDKTLKQSWWSSKWLFNIIEIKKKW